MSELPQQHPLVRPETIPLARVVEQAFLRRLDQLIDQLLGDDRMTRHAPHWRKSLRS